MSYCTWICQVVKKIQKNTDHICKSKKQKQIGQVKYQQIAKMKSSFHSFLLLPNEVTAVTQALLSLSLCISLHLQNQPPEVFCNFTKFARKYLCQCLFFKKVAGLSLPVELAKFLRTPFLQNNLWATASASSFFN